MWVVVLETCQVVLSTSSFSDSSIYSANSNSPRSLHFSDRCEIATAQCRLFPEKKFSISLGTSQPVPAYCAPFILCPKAIGSYLSHIEWNYARFSSSPSQSCIFWGWSFLTCASVVHNVRKDLKVCAPVCQFIVLLVHREINEFGGSTNVIRHKCSAQNLSHPFSNLFCGKQSVGALAKS